MLHDIFDSSEHQEEATYGIGFELTLTRSVDNSAVSNEGNQTIVAKIKNTAIEWHVPHYTASIPQQAMLSKQSSSNTPDTYKASICGKMHFHERSI